MYAQLLRGYALIIRIQLIEIQRKSKEIETPQGIEFKEDKFSGLIFTLTDDIYLTTWLRQVQSELRIIKGIMYHLIGECPGRAATFSHNPPTKNKFEIEILQFVINAFNHMDITFR